MIIQNIYDNSAFFKQYKQLRDNHKGFNAVIEQPAIRGLLTVLEGKRVLDIGCGFGDFCRYARDRGAREVIGIDPSENMLNEARQRTQDDHIHYRCEPIETFQFHDNFDVVVSSLAFHYVENFNVIIKKIGCWMTPGGQLLFSVEHPICTASPPALLGNDQGVPFHPVYNYRDEGVFTQHWFIDGVKKYHRTISTYLGDLLSQGFSIDKVLEPMPTDTQIADYPHLACHKIRPPLLMVASSRQKL